MIFIPSDVPARRGSVHRCCLVRNQRQAPLRPSQSFCRTAHDPAIGDTRAQTVHTRGWWVLQGRRSDSWFGSLQFYPWAAASPTQESSLERGRTGLEYCWTSVSAVYPELQSAPNLVCLDRRVQTKATVSRSRQALQR